MMRRLCPRRLGSFVQANAQRLLLLLSLALLLLCAAINSGKLDTDLSSWIHRTNRVENELQAIETAIGEGSGTNSLLLLQTPQTKNKIPHKQQFIKHKQQQQQQEALENDILSVDSLMIHLEALAIATHVTIDLFDISWSLKDLCFSPTLPDYEGLLVNQMLDHLMPCAIKTPLDCFWEGSKLMGPDQEVRLSSIGPKLKWTNLNPLAMVEAKRRAHPHASFPYDALVSWMKRTGITTGYQDRPCLDPSDPNCPASAPNKISGERPNIAVQLTNGCHGLASKQMHWKEEEIVGGVQHNKSGFIVRASALQSTIQLMGERDVYDYWRKTSKVQDVNNWSTDKARQVLELWQKRFEDELAQFMRTSVASSAYMIHALAPKSMMEPIDSGAVMDHTNFKLSILLFTLAACILFPNFNKLDKTTQATANPKGEDIENVGNKIENADTHHDERDISRFIVILLAFITSLHVILTFVASLGLSSFMNLPFNMMTTQILPPLALYYGFRQSLLIANIYARHYRETAYLSELNTRCLNELLPVIFTEATTLIVPLVVASALPVQATRVFTFQAITYIALSTLSATLLVPALITTFLLRNSPVSKDIQGENGEDRCTIYMKYKTSNYKRSSTPRDSASRNSDDSERSGPTIEEFILSRLQEDLRHIRADSQQPTNINFSAQLKPSSTRASLKLTASRPPTSSGTLNAASLLPTRDLLDQQQRQQNQYESTLPDLIQWQAKRIEEKLDDVDDDANKPKCEDNNCDDETNTKTKDPRRLSHIQRFSTLLVNDGICQALVCLFSIVMFVALMLQCSSVKYGLHLRDIVLRGTPDYDSLMMQEKYFPVYNTFIITRDDFDYPNNQRLLYEFHERVTQVDGVVHDDSDEGAGGSKFWLIYFRDWLLELQENFDSDRNRSSITSEGWSPDASDASKLAYKLLAQTGRVDNPIDKHLVETNRLVDKTGIINPKAFYYYLTAWVMNDAFTYSNSEANFRPEPRTWNENAEDLRIERARPLTYAQIPILMKLPETKDGLKTIIDLRTISQAFEQLGLPNFPTGIPFIFWDQFINLDLLFIAAYSVIAIIYISLACYALANLSLALVLVGPALVTGVELFGLLGYFSIEFNTVIAVLLVSSVGTATLQTIHYVMNFHCAQGNFNSRLNESFGQSFKTMITSVSLLLITAFIYSNSKIDFMIKYSLVFYCLTAINCFNSLVLTPVLVALFAPEAETNELEGPTPEVESKDNSARDISNIIKSYEHRSKRPTTVDDIKRSIQSSKRKKRQSFQRVQSEISLSTISEESRTDSRTCDSKLDFSIRR